MREIWQGYRSVSSIPSLTPDTSGYNYTVTDEAWAETGYPIPFNASTYISQKFSGFLVPPATGRYTIDVLSDDASRIYLSTDSDPANKRLMAEAYAWSRGRWNYWPAQRSQPVDLEGGRPYYLEMVLNQGRGPWSIYLGLKYHNSTLSRSEVTAEHEVQKIAVDSIIVQEHHVSCVCGWMGGWVCGWVGVHVYASLPSPSVTLPHPLLPSPFITLILPSHSLTHPSPSLLHTHRLLSLGLSLESSHQW